MTNQDRPRKLPRLLSGRLPRILALAKPEWRLLVVATVFLFIGSAMGLLYPQALRLMIDAALAQKQNDSIDRIGMAMIAIFMVQGFAVALRYYLFTLAGERTVTRLRHQVFDDILGQEIAFFDERRTGELNNRLASDTTVLQNTVSVNISMALRNVAMVLGGVALLFYSSMTLTLLMLLVVPPIALGAARFGKRIGVLSRQSQDALARAGEIAHESIAGIRTVRAFTGEPVESSRYQEAVRDALAIAKRRIRYVALFQGIVSFTGFAAVALVLWYGGRLVVSGQMTAGDLTSFILYTIIVAFSLGTLGSLWTDFMRASGAAQRIFEIMDRKPAFSLTGGLKPLTITGRIRFKNVDFAYPSRPDVGVLKEIDLEIQPGRVVALVGPSGSGKSTIAKLIGRMYDPGKGKVLLDDRNITDLDATWLRQHIGTVAQEPVLFSTSIADNIRYAKPDSTDAEIEAAAKVANAHDFIVSFPERYETQVGERGVKLSGGQKQRVAIARALIKDPQILILDEATSAMDAESEYLVKQALDRLMQGRTTVVIAHRLSTVKDADLVVVLHGGRIVQNGRHEELMADGEGLYRRLVERQLVADEGMRLDSALPNS